MTYRQTIDFLLYDWLKVESLQDRTRFSDHTRETFASVMDTCEKIAREKYAPFARQSDTEEPWFDGEKVHLPAASHAAANAYAESGMLAAAQDYEIGGMQLPCVVEMAANSFFSKAGIGIGGGGMLTSGNANLLMAHGTPAQQEAFAKHEFSGRFAGTMCLSEPQAGSSLSDVVTRAVPDGADFERDPLGARYRLRGNKMWISNGEHELTENIVHLVLAKIPGPDGKLIPGTRGISLFIVPKKLVDVHGTLTGERNDVALAGLNHKLGYRGIPNTLLNFGEGKFPVRAGAGAGLNGTGSGEGLNGAGSGAGLDGAGSGEGLDGAGSGEGVNGAGSGAIGYLVGRPHEGLRCMFHMMNEARIAVGLGAAMIGYAGYEASLDYARNRPQGRPTGVGGKDATRPQVPIIQHADVKRMLLAQKSYCEGAIALELYCARLVDELHTGEAAASREAGLLLEVLTPIAKSWPSEWCLEANSLAIQVLGGYGYTRDFPVEQYWRDNRLNMIHEGTHGIQGLDLLGRKVVMQEGAGLALVGARVAATIARSAGLPTLAGHAKALAVAWKSLVDATQAAWSTGKPDEALANATPYLQAFGHTVLAWVWLDVAICAEQRLADTESTGSADDAPLHGKLAACTYFFHYELPRVDAWLQVVASRDATCRNMHEAWF